MNYIIFQWVVTVVAKSGSHCKNCQRWQAEQHFLTEGKIEFFSHSLYLADKNEGREEGVTAFSQCKKSRRVNGVSGKT